MEEDLCIRKNPWLQRDHLRRFARGKSTGDDLQLGLRRFLGRSGRESAEHVQARTCSRRDRGAWIDAKRDPVLMADRKGKSLRHHTDDRVRFATDVDLSSDD